ncbi:MAG: hypothetical protein EBR02_05885, partial [Alphaproteobacteria bacterium]|nr:hypothetical protein [Alphaproteobacteria bacterium]
VEGYSSLLWVLLISFLGILKFELVNAAQSLSFVATLLTPLVFYQLFKQLQLGYAPLALGCLIFAISPPVGIWAMSGMEAPLAALLFGLCACLLQPLLENSSNHRRISVFVGIALGFLGLLRPEAPVYIGILLFSFVVFSRMAFKTRIESTLIAGGIAACALAAQLAFRLAYYDEWVPNTVLAKVALSSKHLLHGYQYISKAIAVFLPLLLYIFLQLSGMKKKGVFPERQRFGWFCMSIIGLSCGAIMVAGGDVFMGFRAMLPLLPIMILAMMATTLPLQSLQEKLFVLLIVAYYVVSQFAADVNNHRIGFTEQIRREIGLFLKAEYADKDPLIAVYTAGAVPYYSGLRSLDVFGLTNKELTHSRKTDPHFGLGMPGHDLFNAAFINSKEPDILVFDAIPGIPSLCEQTLFQKNCDSFLLPYYQEKIISLPSAKLRIWVRKDSQKLH